MTGYFQKNLFKNISMEEYRHLLTYLDRGLKQLRAGETTCDYDQDFNNIGTIGRDTASVARYEFNGTRTILERLGPQDILNHLLSYGGGEDTDINMVSDSACNVLFIHHATISSPCTRTRTYHHQPTQNPLDMISECALNLSRRVEVSSQRTIREKLMCYFLQLTAQVKGSSFHPPFTMMGLADCLSIDRSVMTWELKRMKEEHIVEMDKRSVRLYI